MTLPVLYSFRRCPYAIRARLALHAAKVEVSLIEVALRNKPAEMLALSPKGTVPVLLRPDGTVLEQSLDIMQWALQQSDPHAWLSTAPLHEMLDLIHLNDAQFKLLLDRYKYPERYPEQPRATYRQMAIDTMLSDLNQRLSSHSHLCATSPCLADMAILPFVRQFAQVDRDWWDTCDLIALRHWLNVHTNSDLFVAVMTKPGL